MMEKSYSLSQEQLKVLLYGKGYDTVLAVGYNIPELEDATVLRVLNELVRNGVLITRDEEFVLIPALKEMIDIIGKAQRCITVISRKGRLPDKCLFIGKRLISCTIRTEDYRLSLCFTDVPQFFDALSQEGYLMDAGYDLMPEEDELTAFERTKGVSAEPDEKLDENSPVVFETGVLSRNGREKAVIKIVEYYYGKYMIVSRFGKLLREPYSPENYQKHLIGLIENDIS